MHVGSQIGLGWIRHIFMPLEANSMHPIFWDLEK